MKSIGTYLATLVVGMGIGWMVKPGGDDGGSVREGNAPDASKRKSGQSLLGSSGIPRGSKADAEALIEKFMQLEREGPLEDTLAAAPPVERRALFQAFEKQVSLFGLTDDKYSFFKEAFRSWAALDPHAAIAWAKGVEVPEERIRLAEDVIETLSDTDLDQAISWARIHLPVENGSFEMPSRLLKNAAQAGEEKLLEVVKLSVNPHNEAWGTGLEYPDGFDFAHVLEELAAYQAGLPEDHKISKTPSNLLIEWAKVDPQGAFEWMLVGNELPFNSGFEPFMKGYGTVVVPSEMGYFLAENVLVVETEPQKQREFFFKALRIHPEPELVVAFAERAPGNFELEPFIECVLKDWRYQYATRDTLAFQAIFEALDRKSRIRILTSEHTQSFRKVERHHEPLTKLLRRLGHSEEEIASVIIRDPQG